jgi:hypothetical protein
MWARAVTARERRGARLQPSGTGRPVGVAVRRETTLQGTSLRSRRRGGPASRDGTCGSRDGGGRKRLPGTKPNPRGQRPRPQGSRPEAALRRMRAAAAVRPGSKQACGRSARTRCGVPGRRDRGQKRPAVHFTRDRPRIAAENGTTSAGRSQRAFRTRASVRMRCTTWPSVLPASAKAMPTALFVRSRSLSAAVLSDPISCASVAARAKSAP